MSISGDYFDYCIEALQKTAERQLKNIEKAAEAVTKSCLKGGRFFVFGSGHSHMIAE